MIIEMKKTQIFMSKPIYLSQAILDVSKTLMYEFLYGYLKPKCRDKLKLCYMDAGSFIIHVETKDFYRDITDDVNEWFDTSNYDKNDKRPLPIGINKKVLSMFKDELGGKIMTEFVALRAKAYAFKNEDGSEHKKAEGTKKCVVKKGLTFENYKEALFNNKTIIKKSQTRFRDASKLK